jgi:hypothetical protein
MVQAEGFLDGNAYSQKTLTQMAVQALGMTDDDGSNTVVTLNDADAMEYVIDASAGAGTYYFYINVPKKDGFKLIGFDICRDAAVAISGTLQQYKGGGWKDNDAYAFSSAASYDDKVVPVYPLEQGIYRTMARIKCVVDGACNIYAQGLIG